ncbi:hypothetical protein NQ315_013799 [Exocentrus adspersus]|uniref:Uncharacterized protein n=1 Tax=Exocentrus adspersus TaxID=1586481 RepID=A0AAV8V6B7_9CUCU|nr:hypothetical protein NQ315_013799 [Exocentrus adspersus]
MRKLRPYGARYCSVTSRRLSSGIKGVEGECETTKTGPCDNWGIHESSQIDANWWQSLELINYFLHEIIPNLVVNPNDEDFKRKDSKIANSIGQWRKWLQKCIEVRGGSLSRALGLTKTKTDRDREKQSPTSSSESSSVISRISPPLQYFATKSSRSGGESPIYAQPFSHGHPSSYQCKYVDHELSACRSIDEYDITKSIQSIRSETVQRENISRKEKYKFSSGLAGGSLHRGKKQHRRVRSIGDIDVIHLEAI